MEKKAVKLETFDYLLIALLIFHLLGNLLWLSLNQAPQSWDAAFHTVLSIRFADYLIKHVFNSFNWHDFLTISKYYPPLTHLISVIFVFLGGFQERIIRLAGTIAFLLSILLTYLVAFKLFLNKKTAFFSALFFSFFLTIFQESRSLMTDLPLTVFLLLGFLALQESNLLTNKKNSLLFFLVLALALLTKWVAPLYFLIPVLFVFIKLVLEKKFDSQVFLNIFLGIILVFAICFPWYAWNLHTILDISRLTFTGELDDPVALLSLDNIFFYLKLLIMFQLGFIGFIFFLISSVKTILQKSEKNKLFIFINLFFLYLFFTFIPNKNIRYLIPLMPYFAMIMAYGLNKIKTLGYLIASWMIVSYLILSFGFPFVPDIKYSVNLPVLGWMDLIYLHKQPVRALFDKSDWKNKEAAEIFLDNLSNATTYYFIDSEKEYFNASTFHVALYGLKREVVGNIQELNTNFPEVLNGAPIFQNDQEIYNYVKNANIVFIPQNEIGPGQGIRDFKVREQIQDFFLQGKANGFVLINKISLPDSDVINVYKNLF